MCVCEKSNHPPRIFTNVVVAPLIADSEMDMQFSGRKRWREREREREREEVANAKGNHSFYSIQSLGRVAYCITTPAHLIGRWSGEQKCSEQAISMIQRPGRNNRAQEFGRRAAWTGPDFLKLIRKIDHSLSFFATRAMGGVD